MKALLLLLMFFIATTAVAQWNTNSTHIYNTNSGNVGIGNSSPSFKLDVTGSLRTTDFINANQYVSVLYGGSYVVALNGQGDGYISGRNTAYQDKFVIASNGASYFNGGNVGIGTNGPNDKLEIANGGLRLQRVTSSLTGGTTYGQIYQLQNLVNTYDGIVYQADNHQFRNYDGTAEVTINNGSIGIGLSTPGDKLDVANGGIRLQRIIAPLAGGTTYGQIFELKDLIGTSDGIVYQADLHQFRNYDGGAELTINNGNIGIGTTTPGNKLQIGSNPGGFNGNDLVVSNSNGSLAISNGTSYGVFYGTGNIAIQPGYGKMAVYASETGNVGIGTSTLSNARLSVYQSSNTDWAAYITNDGGSGKGLRIKGASGDELVPLLQVEDNLDNNRFCVFTNGLVGIGTSAPDARLTVKGNIHTQEVKVDLTGAVAPDYVFEKDYNLFSLSETEEYINQHKHLPEVPSAKQMEEEGLNLKEMNLILLKKVEELTLHLIEMDKVNAQQHKVNEEQKKINAALLKKINELNMHK